MCDDPPSICTSFEHLQDRSCPSNLLLNNRYSIIKPLSQGGFSKTFLAIDQKYQAQTRDITSSKESTLGLCVVKHVVKQFFPQPHTINYYAQASELFHQESILLAELCRHPQIPLLLDIFEDNGQQYIVQQWVDGQSLEQELAEEGVFNEAEIWQLLRELLPVLQSVHEHQVIHRNIKPANIIRRQTDRQLVLVDFGAAKYFPSSILEQTVTLVGSPEYAAPEQMKGKAVFASDLYSLGISCLRLLTQMSPFDLYDCAEDTWIWQPYLAQPISQSLEQILYKLLRKATRQRYQSAAKVLLDLNTLPKHTSVSPKSTTSMRTNDDDFETPYFGFSSKENLQYASTISYANKLDIHSISSVTLFDPQTQAWYYLPSKMEAKQITQKVTTFLERHLATTTCTFMIQDNTSTKASSRTMLKTNKILWKIFAATIVATSFAWLFFSIQSHSTDSAWEGNNTTVFQKLFIFKQK